MATTDRSSRRPGTLVRLACLVAILACSVHGCTGNEPLSAEDQAKGKAAFKKRFENSGEKVSKKTR